MKQLISAWLILLSVSAYTQKANLTTEAFQVVGQVKKELTFTLSDIAQYPAIEIKDVPITNHLGEPRRTATQLKGVLVKDLLKGMELREGNPKLYSEFYLTFVAADNYKVVFSWNEIFNSPTGDHVFVITSRDGKNFIDMSERILVLTPTDFKTGRRHIKGLSKIEVKRAD